MKNVPKCCGKRMKISLETPRFMEVQCPVCNDTVYLKKSYSEQPQMIDD